MTEAGVDGDIRALLEAHEPPCLSLYLPTHRRHPENAQDPIRYRNLVRQLEESLRNGYDGGTVEALLGRYRALGDDGRFWNHTWDGLAVLGAGEMFRVIKLQRPVKELAVAARTFHLKPLLRQRQATGRFQVLSLSRGAVRLFEGDRDQLDEVELAAGVPRTIAEALGEEHTEPHLTVTSHGGTAQGSQMRHGHGSRQDESEIDEERFFRVVDRAILEQHSRATGLPVILASLAQYHTPFRRLSHNPMLVETSIAGDAGALTAEQLRQRAWAILEPEYRARLQRLAEAFGEAKAKGRGSDDIREVARAAAEGRVETLLVEEDRRVPGHLEPVTGSIASGDLADPHVDDVLDDLAEIVLRKSGRVVVAPAAEMPVATGLAATYRF
jgi:hypothetical protein